MKKLTLILVAVACLCSGKANAQDGKGSINFVPYVGVNYSDFSGEFELYAQETTGKVNFMGGALLEFKVADKSAVIADVNYRRLGTKAKERGTFSEPKSPYSLNIEPVEMVISEDKKFTLDYLSFGLQFKQNIIDRLSVRAGFECSYLLSARKYYNWVMYYNPAFDSATGMYTLTPEDRVDDFDFFNGIKSGKDYYEEMDDMSKVCVSVPLGITYEYKNFSLNATYHLPLTNCDSGWDDHIRNQAFDFTIGYRLPLRKR